MNEENANIEKFGSKKIAIVYVMTMLIYAVFWLFTSLATNVSGTYSIELRGIGTLEISRWMDIFIFPACMTIGFYMLTRLTENIAKWNWSKADELRTSSFTGVAVMFFLILFLIWSMDLYIPRIIAVSVIIMAICYAGYFFMLGEKGMSIGFTIGGVVGTSFASGIALGWLAGMMIIIIEAAPLMLFISMIHMIQKEDKAK